MKGRRLMAVILVAAVVAVLTSPILAFPGGVSNSNNQVTCDNGKHSGGTAVIAMGGSPLSPAPGQQVTVWVNVSGANVGGRLGVMIVSSLLGSSTLPSNDGWAIVSDPSGTAFNFNELTTAVAGANSFRWTLTAPSGGAHTLYSKAFYAGPTGTTYTQGLTFNVAGGPAGNTTVSMTVPTAGSTVSGTVTVSASPVNAAGISYAVLRVDGTVIANLTSAPYSWSWVTSQYSDGAHVLNVTAAGADGTFGYVQQTVTVANAAAPVLDQVAWQWTALALALSSVAAISLILVLILMVKRRRTGGGA
jgi:hypothetical protein